MPMTYRDAVRYIKERGGVFLEHGKEHDTFMMPWGTKIRLPRHRGDLKPGVEDDVKKRADGIRR